ncbi:hypothetical protein COU57_04475 [Candidatus Pacearchaeota archaeon CG10_big_fil_rev_8_21_14_0_10_32_14]|nr:MAG: hypothetical protein COU57_04475 [Candidatus Pacearchaeota archaeon CG10_big_fil_rev_8_21_14_0_10_32_14]
MDKANVLIVVCIDKGAKIDSWLEKHEQHYYSGVSCLQNMWLASWDLGLGACWVTLDEDKARKVLSIPVNQKIIGGLAIGYAKNRKIDQVPLKDLKEIVHYEKFSKS